MRCGEFSTAPRSASEALIDTIARRLRPRNYVLFSGGLDSSLVLSATAAACRRAGIDPPVPVTQRHPGCPEVDESRFQVAVMRHLGLDDWVVLNVADELDILGEHARHELRLQGLGSFVRFPSYAWVLAQLSEPGLLLSGEGGDVVLGAAPMARVHRVRLALHKRRWRRHALVDLARWPRERWTGRPPSSLPWLTPHGRRQVRPRLRETTSGSGWTMKSSLQRFRSKRTVVSHIAEWESLTDRFGMDYLAPLLDIEFINEFTATVPDHQFINRNIMLRTQFAGMVPAAIEQRTGKCLFNAAIYGRAEVEFARRWTGEGVPGALVRPEVLRRSWIAGDNARNWLLLQHAWLATEGAT